jgi:hypothetical protein
MFAAMLLLAAQGYFGKRGSEYSYGATPRPGATPSTNVAPSENAAMQNSTVFRLRERWIKEWAYQTNPTLGKLYGDYLTDVKSRRGSAFEALVTEIGNVATASRGVTGENCLEMLGPPDFWRDSPDGRAALVYLYTSAPGGKLREVGLAVNSKGEVDQIGWNLAGINDYAKLGFHP